MAADVLARSLSDRGELVLRRRADGALELRVNGVFVMDTLETSSERALATAALRLTEPARLVVGGLGLGFTLAELLTDSRVRDVLVAEIEPTLVQWMGDGTVPHGPRVLADARVRVRVGDVRDLVEEQPAASLDAILLDVDNGPDFLVLDTNARLYEADFLARVHAEAAYRRRRADLVVDALSGARAHARGRRRLLDGRLPSGPARRSQRDLLRLLSTTLVTSGPMSAEDFRIEHDTMGEVRVPKDALWRAQTQRAVENFPISGTPLESAHVKALAQVKAACARANAELGVIDKDMADAIVAAADVVAAGEHDREFPIDVFQTGSGTSSNMNTNEVLATLATRSLGREVHPNDHVNASQSSNDVFPTSIHLAATAAATNELVPALDHLATALEAKAAELASVVKSGRTHLMDATPVTLGQEFGGYAAQVRKGITRIQASLPRVAEVPLGGTAVGTGINTPLGFPQRVIELLAAATDCRSARRRTTSRRTAPGTGWSSSPVSCAPSR
jgi:hypothetical protein